jgi:hypothetical protein
MLIPPSPSAWVSSAQAPSAWLQATQVHTLRVRTAATAVIDRCEFTDREPMALREEE